jgi:hypothetical protein
MSYSSTDPYQSLDDLDTPVDPFLSEDNSDEQLLDELEGESEVTDDREGFTDSVFTPVLHMDELEDLLAESVSLHQESRKGIHLRKELARAKSVEERAALQAKIRSWEDAYEWKSLAHCALVEVTTCACVSVTKTFGGYFYHQVHRTTPNTQRWVRTDDSGQRFEPSFQNKLKKQVLIKETLVTVCPNCLHDLGFDLTKGEHLWEESQATPKT